MFETLIQKIHVRPAWLLITGAFFVLLGALAVFLGIQDNGFIDLQFALLVGKHMLIQLKVYLTSFSAFISLLGCFLWFKASAAEVPHDPKSAVVFSNDGHKWDVI